LYSGLGSSSTSTGAAPAPGGAAGGSGTAAATKAPFIGALTTTAASAAACGLDWELPSASMPGSTELLSLLSDAQLSTQAVSLRVCDLKSCALVEHESGTFISCPRCQSVAYCSVEHRRLAWRSWHSRECSVTQTKIMKPGQTRRYPVRMQQRLHSGVPMGAKAALMRDDIPHQPAITRIG